MENNKDWVAAVKLFQDTFEKPFLPTSNMDWAEMLSLRADLVGEEVDEFWHGMSKVMIALRDNDKHALAAGKVEMLDAICDSIYVLIGTANKCGFDLSEAFRRVQESNMAKLWPDGKVHYNSVGKVIKPDGWTPPRLEDLAA